MTDTPAAAGPAAARADRPVLAISSLMVALFLFTMMGLVVKHLSPRYGAAELSAYRNLFGLIPAVLALYLTASWRAAGRPLKIRQWKLAFLRGGFVVFAQFMFYTSLGLIPFATATTISHADAIFMTALAAPILGERVGPVRWIAVLIGFVGVVLVTGPGRADFQWAMLLPVGAAALYAMSGVTARLLDADVPSALVNLYGASFAAFGSVTLALVLGGFTPVASWADMGWIVAMGGFGGTAVLFLVAAFRLTEQANLAPFTYFVIPIAFASGWVFFGEAPVDDLFPGAILIAVGGLMIVWRERQKMRRPKPVATPE